MKVYSISKFAFYGICILILILPVSRHWRLLTSGSKTTGTVSSFTRISREGGDRGTIIEDVSEIRFQAGDLTCITYGPVDMEYEIGRSLIVYYQAENHDKNCVFCFSALYLTDYSVLPLIMLVVWAAFYLSYNNYSKQSRKKQSKEVAFSPFRKTGYNKNPEKKDHPEHSSLSG